MCVCHSAPELDVSSYAFGLFPFFCNYQLGVHFSFRWRSHCRRDKVFLVYNQVAPSVRLLVWISRGVSMHVLERLIDIRAFLLVAANHQPHFLGPLLLILSLLPQYLHFGLQLVNFKVLLIVVVDKPDWAPNAPRPGSLFLLVGHAAIRDDFLAA